MQRTSNRPEAHLEEATSLFEKSEGILNLLRTQTATPIQSPCSAS